MSNPILVAYATRYGSTREVAELICETLVAEGPGAEAWPIRKLASIENYSALVIGAPLYFGAWLKEARSFLAARRHELALIPVAVFALGPSFGTAEELGEACENARRTLVESIPLEPMEARVFGGRYDPSRLGLLDRLIAGLPASPLHGARASDARDRSAIEAWARSLAARLRG